jgi:hypothetical protein
MGKLVSVALIKTLQTDRRRVYPSFWKVHIAVNTSSNKPTKEHLIPDKRGPDQSPRRLVQPELFVAGGFHKLIDRIAIYESFPDW